MRIIAVCKYFLLLVMAMLLTLPAGIARAAGVDWDEGRITVQGVGVAPPNAVNFAQARMLARRAAVVDGYRQLAEAVRGVNVDAETTVENMMVTSDVIRTNVSALVQGARVVAEAEIPGGGYQVTMEVAMFGVSDSVARAVLQRPAVIEPFPQPVPSVAPAAPSVSVSISVNVNVNDGTMPAAPAAPAPPAVPAAPATPASPVASPVPAVHVSTMPRALAPNVPAVPTPAAPSLQLRQSPAGSQEAVGGFTGLVVDCRGLGLKPVMSPVIKNAEGTPIYGHKNLDFDKVVAQGMAAYTDSPEKLSRAGSKPLVVKAVALDNFNGNPVISVADANRVLIENGKSGFLENLKVVFLR